MFKLAPKHVIVILACLLLGAGDNVLASSSPAEMLGPLDADLKAALNTIESDPPPPNLVHGTHYAVSDEEDHHVFRAYIENRGGVFIGIGTNQNFLMAAHARPKVLVLFDFDQVVVDVHHLYQVAFLDAKTPDAFLKFFYKDHTATTVQKIEAFYDRNPERKKRVLKAFRNYQRIIFLSLRNGRDRHRNEKIQTYLTDQGDYDYLVGLFRQGRVLMLRGDLTQNGAMQALGKVLHEYGLVVRVYYPSNAEQYFRYNDVYRENMRALPYDEDTVVVRTRAWTAKEQLTAWELARFRDKEALKQAQQGGAKTPGTPPLKEVVYYTYATQTWANFMGWIVDPKVRYVRQMLPHQSRVKNALYPIAYHALPPR